MTGRRVGDLEMPEGSLLISVLRDGKGFVPGADTVLEAGDEVLAVLDPGHEEELKELFGPGERRQRGGAAAVADREVDFLLVGGGMASAHCAAELRKRGRRGLDPAGRARARAALRTAAAVQGVPARRGGARGRLRQPALLVRGERGRAAAPARNVMSLDPAARTAKLQGGEEVALRARR